MTFLHAFREHLLRKQEIISTDERSSKIFCYAIVNTSLRPYHLCANTHEEVNKWDIACWAAFRNAKSISDIELTWASRRENTATITTTILDSSAEYLVKRSIIKKRNWIYHLLQISHKTIAPFYDLCTLGRPTYSVFFFVTNRVASRHARTCSKRHSASGRTFDMHVWMKILVIFAVNICIVKPTCQWNDHCNHFRDSVHSAVRLDNRLRSQLVWIETSVSIILCHYVVQFCDEVCKYM